MNKALWQCIGLIGLCCVLAACGGSRTHAGPTSFDEPNIAVSKPLSMVGGQQSVWQVSIDGGTPPYQVTWDFGAGALEPVGEKLADGIRTNITAVMLNPEAEPVTYVYTFTVTDALGYAIPHSGNYTVAAGEVPTRPVIESAEYRADVRELVVEVSHWHAPAELRVDLALPAGMNAPITSESRIAVGTSEFRFKLWPDDVMDGNTGTVLIDASDSFGFSDQLAAEITVPGYELAQDTLYAIPLQRRVKVGELVTVVVATGPIAEHKPFQYMSSVSLTFEDGVSPDSVSTNAHVGLPGGGQSDVDGIWEFVNPQAGFLLGPATIIVPAPLAVGTGRLSRWYSLTPIGGNDVTGVQGALFTMWFRAVTPGLYHLGFQESVDFRGTYYQDGLTNIYTWGTLMADEMGNLNVEGWDNTFTVVE